MAGSVARPRRGRQQGPLRGWMVTGDRYVTEARLSTGPSHSHWDLTFMKERGVTG